MKHVKNFFLEIFIYKVAGKKGRKIESLLGI